MKSNFTATLAVSRRWLGATCLVAGLATIDAGAATATATARASAGQPTLVLVIAVDGLRVGTLGDALRYASGNRAKVVTVSGKDRRAACSEP